MFEVALHRRVALSIALVALALSGAAVPVTASTDVSPTRTDERVTETNPAVTSSDANATIDHDGPIVLRSAPNQSVRVRSDAPAGTEVSVRLSSTKFNVLKSRQVTVGDDGTGTATFDLSDVDPGVPFTVSVSTNRDNRVEGVVVDESATVHRDATFAISDPASNYTIRGRVVNYATELDVDLTVEGATYSETVTVGEDGGFAASFDLSSVSKGAEATVEVGGTPRSVNAVVATVDSRDPTVYALVEPANATIRFPEETLLVHATSNQTVHGTTNVRPGTELTVKAENDELNSPNSFVRTDTVTVREDGTFVAELNFTGVEPGTNFTLVAGPGLASTKGQVVDGSVAIPTVTTTARSTTADESGFSFTTTTSDDSPDGHVDEFGVPGFGVLAALVALLAGLALARRN